MSVLKELSHLMTSVENEGDTSSSLLVAFMAKAKQLEKTEPHQINSHIIAINLSLPVGKQD